MERKLGNVLCGLIATTILFSCLVAGNLAQVQQQQQCLNELRFCINYLNNTSQPPDSCCQPLDYVVKSIPECFCSLMSSLGFNRAEQAGIDVSKAQTLPGRCGQHINPLGCITGAPDAGPNNSTPNSLGSKLWSLSLVTAIGASSIFLNLQAFKF